jgi:hypothetical protein
MAASQGVTVIPREIDVHLQMFGKEPWEVDYDLYGYCDMCNSRIDEFGYCACGGSVRNFCRMCDFHFISKALLAQPSW